MTLTALVALLVGACAEVPLAPQESLPEAAAQETPAKKPPLSVALAVVENTSAAPAVPAVSAVPAAPPPVQAAEQASPQPADMWERLRLGFRMPDMDNRRVRMWERWYSARPEYVANMVDRSSRFLHYVMEEVERRNMPAEIALLPMIESAYNPYAYSRAHASGMWQFIPSTGRLYGLRQTYWYDGRRDVLAATSAALDYLEDLHAIFGSWDLALAAYNMGEGGLSRAIARNKRRKRPTNYESLRMPRETRNYLPKLQAVKNIILDPARYGLQLADVPNQPYFATITTERHIDVELAAQLAEVSLEEFRILNSAHRKPVIRADGQEMIFLPRDNVEIFQKNLEAHDEPLVSWGAYKVKRRDRLSKIAAKHGVSMAYLKKMNGISKRRRVRAGQTIVVPLKNGVEPYLPDLPAPKIRRARYKKKYKRKSNKKFKRPDTRTSAPVQGTTRLVQKSADMKQVQATIQSAPRKKNLILAQHRAQ